MRRQTNPNPPLPPSSNTVIHLLSLFDICNMVRLWKKGGNFAVRGRSEGGRMKRKTSNPSPGYLKVDPSNRILAVTATAEVFGRVQQPTGWLTRGIRGFLRREGANAEQAVLIKSSGDSGLSRCDLNLRIWTFQRGCMNAYTISVSP